MSVLNEMVSSCAQEDAEFWSRLMLSGSTVLRVRPRDGHTGWEVMEPGGTRPLLRTKERQTAVRRARVLLERGGTVETLGPDERVLATDHVEGPGQRPRWYVPARPATWVLVALFPLSTFVNTLRSSPGKVYWWLSLAAFLLSLVSVTLFVLSRRRDRQLSS